MQIRFRCVPQAPDQLRQITFPGHLPAPPGATAARCPSTESSKPASTPTSATVAAARPSAARRAHPPAAPVSPSPAILPPTKKRKDESCQPESSDQEHENGEHDELQRYSGGRRLERGVRGRRLAQRDAPILRDHAGNLRSDLQECGAVLILPQKGQHLAS